MDFSTLNPQNWFLFTSVYHTQNSDACFTVTMEESLGQTPI